MIKKKRSRVRLLSIVNQMKSLIIISIKLKYSHPTKYFLWNLWYQWVVSAIHDEKCKPPTGENLVLHERINRVNPNGGKQGEIPEKESPGIANPEGNPSWHQTELILRCQRENSNKDLNWRQNELIPRRQRKRKGIPEKEYPEFSFLMEIQAGAKRK